MTSKFYKYIDPDTGDWVSDSLSMHVKTVVMGSTLDGRLLATTFAYHVVS